MDFATLAAAQSLMKSGSLKFRLCEHKSTDADNFFSWVDGGTDDGNGKLFIPVLRLSQNDYLMPVALHPGYSADYMIVRTGQDNVMHYYNFSFSNGGMLLSVHKEIALTETS